VFNLILQHIFGA